MDTRRRILALTLCLLIGMAPAAALALDDPPALGEISAITASGTASVSSGAQATVTHSEENSLQIAWSPADPSIGRNQDGWWVGIKAAAPAGMDETALQAARYLSPGGTTRKSFWQNKDGQNPAWIGLWGLVTEERLARAQSGGEAYITYTWQFDWDNDEAYEQTFTLKIAPASIQALQTPADPVDSPAAFARDPGQTGGEVEMQVSGDTIAFTGTAAYYPADSSVGRDQAGNYVGLKITRPASVTATQADAVVTIDGQAHAWNDIKDGDDFFYYYPMVTEQAQSFTVTIDWDGPDKAVYAPKTYTVDCSGLTLTDPAPQGPTATIQGGQSYASLADAVANARSGDTIVLSAGTFTLTEQLVVDKALTLVGAGKGETLLDYDGSQGSPTGRAYVGGRTANPVVYATGALTLQDLTIRGVVGSAGHALVDGVYATAGLQMNNAAITDVRCTADGADICGVQTGRAVMAVGCSVSLESVDLLRFQKQAVDVSDVDLTVRNSTIQGCGDNAIIAQNGLVLRDGTTAAVTGTTISAMKYTAQNEWANCSIAVYAMGGSNASLSGNTITGADNAFYGDAASALVFTGENIVTDCGSVFDPDSEAQQRYPVREVALDPSALTLQIGQSRTLTASVTPENAEDAQLTWTSSDPAVATVDNGVVRAVGAGSARITAAAANGKSAVCQVTVQAPASVTPAPSATPSASVSATPSATPVASETPAISATPKPWSPAASATPQLSATPAPDSPKTGDDGLPLWMPITLALIAGSGIILLTQTKRKPQKNR